VGLPHTSPTGEKKEITPTGSDPSLPIPFFSAAIRELLHHLQLHVNNKQGS
jgi:hypothetical protein